MISWNARLGCSTCVSAGPMMPTTRSIASFGRTYIFMPAAEASATMATNIRTVIKNMGSNLDIHDFFHDHVTQQLQADADAHHDVADLIFKEELHVLGIGVEHQNGDRDRNTAQRSRGHASVRADRADAAAQLEAFPNYVGELVQNFCQVAAGALLQQHGRYKEVHVQRGNTLGQALQGHFDGQTEVGLFKGTAEFSGNRLRKLAIDHFQRY